MIPAVVYERHRSELTAYATRLVLRPEIAEELVQEAAVRLLEDRTLPDDDRQIRAWLFRVVSNLAIDHLRRHGTWREQPLLLMRTRAEADERFVAESQALTGSPEMTAIAREHLAVCFACTLRLLDPHKAAALLLKEVQGLTVNETADALAATPVQVKNWLQDARRALDAHYARTCALITKQGVCHQCVELDGYFNRQQRDPLAGTARDLDARLKILQTAPAAVGGWHRRLLDFVDQALRD